MTLALGWLWRASVLGFLAFAVFGPLANLLLWAFAIQWYYPHRLPLAYGFATGVKYLSRPAIRSPRSAPAF